MDDNTDIKPSDLYIGNPSKCVINYIATEKGKVTSFLDEINDNADIYVMTMTFEANDSVAYSREYYVRAYVKLNDGTYRYSEVVKYRGFEIAKILYDNCMASSEEWHDYLYDNIIAVVEPAYIKVDYKWNNFLVR